PLGNDPGEVQPVYFTVLNRLLRLTDRRGNDITNKENAAMVWHLSPDDDPRAIALVLARKLRGPENPFNRRIEYPSFAPRYTLRIRRVSALGGPSRPIVLGASFSGFGPVADIGPLQLP